MEHITLHCPQCGETFTVVADAAGQTANCPQCAETLVVPQAVPAGTGDPPGPVQTTPSAPAKSGPPAAGLATASLVLGIFSLFTAFLAPVLVPPFVLSAIICGRVARKRALCASAQDQNAKRARIGMSLGCLGFVICLVGILLPAFGPHGDVARPINCAANLKQIDLACKMYASDYSENFPPNLTALWKGNYLTASKIYTCPSTHTLPAETAETLAAHCDYLYFGGGKNEAQIGDNHHVLACDKPANHRRYINVVYGDGHAAQVKQDFKQFLRDNHLILPAQSAENKKE